MSPVGNTEHEDDEVDDSTLDTAGTLDTLYVFDPVWYPLMHLIHFIRFVENVGNVGKS